MTEPFTYRHRLSLSFLLMLIVGLFSHAPGGHALENALSAVHVDQHQVPVGQSKLFKLRNRVSRISVGDPATADILLINPRQLYVVGKKPGTTNLIAWDANGANNVVFNIQVTHDLDSLKAKLYELMPAERIEVGSSGPSIVLSGEISSLAKMEAAVDVARSFLPGKKGGSAAKSGGGASKQAGVINLMHVGGAQQVMLEVKVAEISRSLLKRLNVQFKTINTNSDLALGAVNGSTSFPPFVNEEGLQLSQFFERPLAGPDLEEIVQTPHQISNSGLFLRYLSGDFLFNLTIDAAKDHSLAKILAEPTLTTLTGQEATFLAGGEFPIPVPQGGQNNSITIKFKEFGIATKFVPVVLDSGHINLKMHISVSDLTQQAPVIINAVTTASTFVVPSLTVRRASSALELADGQTMGIAGLISSNLRESVQKFPGLGNLPVLGPLFRSQDFERNESELVIFVTPHLARPLIPEEIRLPTDQLVEPDDFEFYLMGRLEGRAPQPELQTPVQPEGGIEGPFGHQLSEGGA